MRKNILIGPIALLAIWFFITHFGLVKPIFLSSPKEVFMKLWWLITSDRVTVDLLRTVTRLVLGLTLGICIGVPIGIALGYSRKLYESLEFVVDFFRSIPVACLFPLFLVLFGIGDVSMISAAAWSSSLILLINTMYGVRHSKVTRAMVAKTMKASQYKILTKVIIPDSLPQIFVGFRLSLSIALIVLIVAEMFMGTTGGLGRRIYNASLTYSIPEMYATIFIAGFLGYLLNKLFVLMETRFIHWAGK